MATQTIYVLNDVEGESVEAKAYQIIADAYDEVGYEQVEESHFPDNLAMVKALFRIASITLKVGTPQRPEEWEVVVEGANDDIEEYQDILHQVE